MTCSTDYSAEEAGTSQPGDDATASSSPIEYLWASACARPGGPDADTSVSGCIADQICAEDDERLYRLWGRPQGAPEWEPLYTRCFAEAPDEPLPQVTPAMVLNEIRRIGLPELRAHTQPADKTLVNFDTIFYTNPQPFAATVTLLGQTVDIEARPTAYQWNHGDGTTQSTATAGAPYPAKTITHRYQHTDQLRTNVTVTYTARFRVNGGDWDPIEETVAITGPDTGLQVTEATPQLSGRYD
jgi:hypothetical protein